jgi:hypothetical protein
MSRNLTYDQWLPYKNYEKHECDIKLKDGTIIKHVYPNAGQFQSVCGKTFERMKSIPESEVAEIMYVRYYQNDLCKGNCNE